MRWKPEDEPATVDRWLTVWTMDGGMLSVEPSEEGSLDAAVERWIRERRDTLLSLTILGGFELRYLASQIVGWRPSTPELRLLEAHQEKRDAEEKLERRQAAGLPFEDPA